MTKGLLIITFILFILITVCPIVVNLTVLRNIKEKEVLKKSLTIISVINIVSLFIVLSLWTSPIKNNELTITDNDKSKTENVTLESSGFNELSLNDYLELIKKDEKSIILVARPTCGYCQKFTPILKEAKDEFNLTVNYVNTDNFEQADWTTFTSSLDYLGSEEWGTPLLLIVQNNKVVDYNNGYVELSGLKEFLQKNGYGN